MLNTYASVNVDIILVVVGAFVLAGAVFGICFLSYVARRVFEGTLVRKDQGTWGYECSCPENPEQMKMWEEGVSWDRENLDRMTEVNIVSRDGLSLHGRYYDFGGDKAVIFLPGRCECALYSCYFAKPYAQMGFSVLAIDVRCHGKSEGKYSTIGKYEGADAADWAEFLQREMGITEVWLHGICLGCAAAFVAATGEDAPECIEGIVAEGPYVTFRETYKQHLIQLKKPVWPLVDLIMRRIKKATGVEYKTVAPITLCEEYTKRILYIFGEEDTFSLPPRSRELYAKTKSSAKAIKWLKKGSHSHLRVNNEEEYDNAVKDYIGYGK